MSEEVVEYIILCNSKPFGFFNKGDMSRFGVKFDDKTAMQEFYTCVLHWACKGSESRWSLFADDKRLEEVSAKLGPFRDKVVFSKEVPEYIAKQLDIGKDDE